MTICSCCVAMAQPSDAQRATRLREVDAKLGSAPIMGLNLAGLCDWNTELPFVDVFLESRQWISQRRGASWGAGPALELDEHGWVKRLEADCFAEVPLCTISGGHYPSGVYTVLYDGRGKLEFGNARVTQEAPGKTLIDVDSNNEAFWLRIVETDPEDYVRNIHVYLPGYGSQESRAECGVWNPQFLKRWSVMKVFRTMDWQATNNNSTRTWSERPKPTDASYALRGMPLEIICDFISHVDADLWICVPDDADDDYVKNMAQTLHANLDATRKVYVEYSNEVWNPSFEQYRRSAAKGRELGLATSDWEAAWLYTARRSVEIFTIFEEVFGGTERLVRILPTQAVNAYVSEQIVSYQDAWRHADALAIAPYLEMGVSEEARPEYEALGLDGILERVETHVLSESIKHMREQKELADRYGLALVCYESGQGLVGLFGANDHDTLNDLLIGANGTERMGAVYREYFKAWEELGGRTLCHFSSVGRWSKWGSWGLIEYADQTTADVPKYRETIDCAKRWNKR
ncbi:MAG: hypothetical protein Q4G03_06300 [Planctomycetia bacterium]|nr:hypothetical protein [Planctomycetia bacterium]